MLTSPSKKFSHVSVAEVGLAISENRRLQADYVLRLVLGEFLDAFPMTFRPDYAILQAAELWCTKNGALVWIQKPLESRGTNLRDYHRLLDELAEVTIEHLVEARVDQSMFAKSEVIHPTPGPTPGLPDDELPRGGGADGRSVAERLRQPKEYKARRKAIRDDL